MDITLERILSLIPHKENGKPIKGAYKEFAENIGYSSGDIVPMWKNGTSDSYKRKLYEISKKYDVSVEWLKGETDEKTPLPTDMDSEKRRIMENIMDYARGASTEQLQLLEKLIDNMK